MPWDFREDGITHINVYSKGQTALGRHLSNFSLAPFECPEFGKFASIEGYWYFLLSGNEALRDLAGVEAKRVGRKSKPGKPPEFFERCVRRALRLKIVGSPRLAAMLRESSLPLTHYYVQRDHDTGERMVKPVDSHPWVIEELEDIRARLQGENRPEVEPDVASGDQISLL